MTSIVPFSCRRACSTEVLHQVEVSRACLHRERCGHLELLEAGVIYEGWRNGLFEDSASETGTVVKSPDIKLLVGNAGLFCQACSGKYKTSSDKNYPPAAPWT